MTPRARRTASRSATTAPGSRPLFARTVLVDGDVTVVVDLLAHTEQRRQATGALRCNQTWSNLVRREE